MNEEKGNAGFGSSSNDREWGSAGRSSNQRRNQTSTLASSPAPDANRYDHAQARHRDGPHAHFKIKLETCMGLSELKKGVLGRKEELEKGIGL